MRQRLPLTIAAAAIAIVVAFPAAVSANHSWGGYHWARTSNPFTVKAGDNVSGLWDGMLDTALSDWTQSTVLNMTKAAGGTNGTSCQPTLGRDEICSANYGNTGWLGLAQIWIYTGGKHIAQGIVKNNDYYFGSSSYTYNNTAEMQHVICQEIGHTLGLDHQSETGASLNTCMDYYHNTSSTDLLSTSPNQGDYDELRCIYDPVLRHKLLITDGGTHKCRGTGHLDTTNSATSTAGNANGLFPGVAAEASSWGRLVASSASGREQTFFLELGNDRGLVTFVIWAF
jgi:hypothetical protein